MPLPSNDTISLALSNTGKRGPGSFHAALCALAALPGGPGRIAATWEGEAAAPSGLRFFAAGPDEPDGPRSRIVLGGVPAPVMAEMGAALRDDPEGFDCAAAMIQAEIMDAFLSADPEAPFVAGLPGFPRLP